MLDTNDKKLKLSTSNEDKFILGQREFDENEIVEQKEENQEISNNVEVNLTNTDEPSRENVDNDESFEDLVPIEQNETWCNQSKHVFILSEAGKPIYTLYLYI